jgi:TrmH family RNA methyltransferase
MHKEITSLQNPLIKQLVLLKDKSRERKKSASFIIEGFREIGLAVKGGYQLQTLLYCPEIFDVNSLSSIPIPDENCIAVSNAIYQKISYRTTTEGVLAIATAKLLTLENLQFKNKNPLILVAEAPEKPGNIGALLRTADAANIDAVLIANPKTDLYNPNIIRSSVGCVFTTQIATGSTDEIIAYLKNKHINVYGAALSASVPYHTIDFNAPSAIVVGTEATGLSESWLQSSKKNIIIPMQGQIDSMNVSVSAAIIIFEAKRQRDFQ